MHHHRKLQRRLMITIGILVVLAAAIIVPLTVNNDLRYDLALQTNLVPGKDAEKLSDADDGALLIVVPLDHEVANGTSPWLYRAQFIAWPNETGNEIENLETGERVQVPLATIDFTAANGDGSLMLMRGVQPETGETAAFTISPGDMKVQQLDSADAVPEVSGDWETPTWEKTQGTCNRPSPDKKFVGCFNRADAASYLAGDWQFDLQFWGDFERVKPLYRGQGFLPWVGFAKNDSVVYLQNENGIVRIKVPYEILDAAPLGERYPSSVATPVD